MTRRPPARPLYLDLPSGPVFAVYHAPSADAAPATAVLLCPPWGWNDVTSYRARRAWAEHLADGGHPTLRFDFPGTGDRPACPRPGRLAAWTEATAAAAAWLRVRRATGVSRRRHGPWRPRVAVRRSAETPDREFVAGTARQRPRSSGERGRGPQASRHSLTGELTVLLPEGWMINGFTLGRDRGGPRGGAGGLLDRRPPTPCCSTTTGSRSMPACAAISRTPST
jgi:hypothetical protein